MSRGRTVTLSWGGGSVTLRGDRPGDTGLFVSGDGIDGWDSAPEAKVTLSERQSADGAHGIDERDVLYAARTVVVSFHAHGRDRDEVTSLLRQVSAACHRLVRIRVVDGGQDTYATGYVRPTVDAKWHGEWATGEIEVVCADPRRYSSATRTANLMASSTGSGGLFFGDSMSGLVFPLNYGEGLTVGSNYASVENGGTSPAYPTITVYGPMDPVVLHCGDGVLSYSQPVSGAPLVLDSLSATATIGGTDVSRNLVRRGFPVVPAGGSMTISLQSSGAGFATVSWHDTYI